MNNQMIVSASLVILYLVIVKRIFPSLTKMKETLKSASILDVFSIFQGHGVVYEESDLRVSLFVLSTVLFAGGQYLVWVFSDKF